MGSSIINTVTHTLSLCDIFRIFLLLAPSTTTVTLHNIFPMMTAARTVENSKNRLLLPVERSVANVPGQGWKIATTVKTSNIENAGNGRYVVLCAAMLLCCFVVCVVPTDAGQTRIDSFVRSWLHIHYPYHTLVFIIHY